MHGFQKQTEYKILKEFQDSLSPSEKTSVKLYRFFLTLQEGIPVTDRKTINLLLMAFVAGLRYAKKNVDKNVERVERDY